jgi:pyrroloquinoline quinone biosynthesis protein B
MPKGLYKMRIKVSFYRLKVKILNLFLFFQIGMIANIFAQPNTVSNFNKSPKLIILGTVQDGGCPHIGCTKACCQITDSTKKVVSLGLIDFEAGKKYLFEATPEIGNQLKYLQGYSSKNIGFQPVGIFLTHAHIGHYAGLMFLGKEALNASKIPVFAMPRMKSYIEENGPWSQLVKLENIVLQSITDQNQLELTPKLKIIPFKVPHRDEFSETVGYKIIGPNKSVLFVPDIDKWQKWESDLIQELSVVDMAFIDGTFFSGVELNNRDMSTIPHPSVQETIKICEKLPASEKNKVHFIHFNHTNPLLNPKSFEYKEVIRKGFHVAKFGEVIEL